MPVLVLALALGGAYAYTEVDRRDQAIAEYTRAVSELTAANQTFQRQVQELGSLRDELTAERDALARERDALATERDQLNAQLAVLQKQVTDLGRSVEEKDRQLTQAWEEGSRQQSRAESAEALSFVLGQVIEIDNQIHDEIWVFLDHIADINHAYNRGNPYAFAAAYGRAEESAKRLDALFAQRQQILAQLS